MQFFQTTAPFAVETMIERGGLDMKKRRLLLSGVSILLMLCLLAGGTMAWFTDTEKVNADFTAGVLDITVEPGKDAETPLSFDNLRPMEYEKDVYKRQSMKRTVPALPLRTRIRFGSMCTRCV